VVACTYVCVDGRASVCLLLAVLKYKYALVGGAQEDNDSSESIRQTDEVLLSPCRPKLYDTRGIVTG
jgi:hypothetical protein